MIEAVSTVTASEPKRAAKETDGSDAGSPFSLALATAALEQRAGASLKVHGGAPSEAAETASPKTAAKDTQRGDSAQTPKTMARAAGEQGSPAPADDNGSYGAVSTKASQDATSPSQPAATNAAIASAFVAPTITVQAANAAGGKPLPQAEGAIRDLASRAAYEARKPAPAEAPKQAQPAQDFARLLARKLDDGATSFHLRLDPPELGRVDARLTMGEDGKAALALAFDNQAALDLFSRGEAQLRASLLAAGFDASGAGISFSLNQRAAETGTEPSAASAAQRLPIASEHSFLAPVSTGVMDVSV